MRILPGPRGDCNGNSSLAIADLSAIALEIFDGDGSFWLDAPNPTYAGSPVGCDANASTAITAADVGCANLLLFGGACAPPLAELAALAPLLEVSTRYERGVVWLRGRLEPQRQRGRQPGLFARPRSRPLRLRRRSTPTTTATPDRLRFPLGAPGLAFVSWNARRPGRRARRPAGRLSGSSRSPNGLLVEVGVPAAGRAERGLRLFRRSHAVASARSPAATCPASRCSATCFSATASNRGIPAAGPWPCLDREERGAAAVSQRRAAPAFVSAGQRLYAAAMKIFLPLALALLLPATLPAGAPPLGIQCAAEQGWGEKSKAADARLDQAEAAKRLEGRDPGDAGDGRRAVRQRLPVDAPGDPLRPRRPNQSSARAGRLPAGKFPTRSKAA